MPASPVSLPGSKTWPHSTIGSELVSSADGDETIASPLLNGTFPLQKRPDPTMVKVKKGDEVAEVSIENARDMVRLDGWTFVAESKPVEETPEAEVSSEAEDETPSKNENDDGSAQEHTVVDDLRAAYKELTGDEPDQRWGKKSLNEKIAVAQAAKDAAEDVAED